MFYSSFFHFQLPLPPLHPSPPSASPLASPPPSPPPPSGFLSISWGNVFFVKCLPEGHFSLHKRLMFAHLSHIMFFMPPHLSRYLPSATPKSNSRRQPTTPPDSHPWAEQHQSFSSFCAFFAFCPEDQEHGEKKKKKKKKEERGGGRERKKRQRETETEYREKEKNEKKKFEKKEKRRKKKRKRGIRERGEGKRKRKR